MLDKKILFYLFVGLFYGCSYKLSKKFVAQNEVVANQTIQSNSNLDNTLKKMKTTKNLNKKTNQFFYRK